MTVKYIDATKTLNDLSMSRQTIQKNFDVQLGKAALEIENTAKRNIQRGTRSGRDYRRRSITHRASGPGEYPKTDTGALVRNIFSERVQQLLYRIGSRGSGAPHGKWLEFGTQKMAARPWLSTSIRDSISKISSIVTNVRVK